MDRQKSEIQIQKELLNQSTKLNRKLQTLERSIKEDYNNVIANELDAFYLAWNLHAKEYKTIRKAGTRGLFTYLNQWSQNAQLPEVVKQSVIKLNQLDHISSEIIQVRESLKEMTNRFTSFNLQYKREYFILQAKIKSLEGYKIKILQGTPESPNQIQAAISRSLQNITNYDLPTQSGGPEWLNWRNGAIAVGTTIFLGTMVDFASKTDFFSGGGETVIGYATKGLSSEQKEKLPTMLTPERYDTKNLKETKRIGDPIKAGVVITALAINEGNASGSGNVNEAYFGHRDPGNFVCNMGAFSVQLQQIVGDMLNRATNEQKEIIKKFEAEAGMPINQISDCNSPRILELSRKYAIPTIVTDLYLNQRIIPFDKQLNKDFQKHGITPTIVEIVRGLDLFIQSPLAAKEYVSRLAYLYKEVIPELQRLKSDPATQKAFLQKSLGGITNLPDYNGQNNSTTIDQLINKDSLTIANLAAILSFNPSLDEEIKVSKFKPIYDAGGLNNFNAGSNKEEIVANMLTDRFKKGAKYIGVTGLNDEQFKAPINTVATKPELGGTKEEKKQRDIFSAVLQYGDKRVKEFSLDPEKTLKDMGRNNAKTLGGLAKGSKVTDIEIAKVEKDIAKLQVEVQKNPVAKIPQLLGDLDPREVKDSTPNKETGLNTVQKEILDSLKKRGIDISKYDVKSVEFWNQIESGKLNVYNLGIKEGIVPPTELRPITITDVPMSGGDSNNFRKNSDGSHRSHDGTDLAAGAGSYNPAIFSGMVIKVIPSNSNDELSIITIQTPDDKLVYELHSQVLVKKGQVVLAGDILGKEDKLGGGQTTGAHRHITVLNLNSDPKIKNGQLIMVKTNIHGGGTQEWNRAGGLTDPTWQIIKTMSYLYLDAKRPDALSQLDYNSKNSTLIKIIEKGSGFEAGGLTNEKLRQFLKDGKEVNVLKEEKKSTDKTPAKEPSKEVPKDKAKDPKKVSMLDQTLQTNIAPLKFQEPRRYSAFGYVQERLARLTEKYAKNQIEAPKIG